MPETKWTEEQQKIIDTRNKNLLVSAAAGSGKTAVLVERIIKMVCDETSEIDIDELLIVTFTNAAAGEIRERIGAALEKKMETDPENGHLQKQLILLYHARISTIHGFCLDVIRNYFHYIGLDPEFRIGDENELSILKSEVYMSVLEEHYKQGGEDFSRIVETYTSDKSDAALEEMIMQLFEHSLSHTNPERWLRSCMVPYECKNVEEIMESEWLNQLMDEVKSRTAEYKETIENAYEECVKEECLSKFADVLYHDIQVLDRLAMAGDYVSYYEMIKENGLFERNPMVSKKDVMEIRDKKQRMQMIRNNTLTDKAKGLFSLREKFFGKPLEDTCNDLMEMRPAVQALLDLTICFAKCFREAKEEKGILDFNDQEHFALQILTKEQDEDMVISEAALELQKQIKEIIIDEYQDSNRVQEMILTSVSTIKEGKPNLFMVGDVKQSIYRFRMADPELFNQKYKTYSAEDEALFQKIELQKNFRSRELVLDNINYIFSRIMKKSLGNVEYDNAAQLNAGFTFPESKNDQPVSDCVEIHVIEKEKGMTKEELEVRVIAGRIKELTGENGLYIFDKGGYRRASYGDITILLRSPKRWGHVFKKLFLEEGIPCYSDTESGYFSAMEVQTMLNLLRVLDNPRQDIPLAAVLRSDIGDFSDEEMAIIGKLKRRGSDLYEGLLAACNIENYYRISKGKKERQAGSKKNQEVHKIHNEQIEETAGKAVLFLERLTKFRKKASYLTVYELLNDLYKETSYIQMMSAMPDGERRLGNLKLLLGKALSFEAGNGSGLFHFLKYIDELYKRETDFGEYVTESEHADAVHIMSIHKSKGLEFPIVFAAGLGRKFNDADNTASFCIHPVFGIGTKYRNIEERYQSDTLISRFIQRKLKNESHGEELRVLYVALTRAKEKLIMTGVINKAADSILKCAGEGEPDKTYRLEQAGSFFDWLIPACSRNKAFEKLVSQCGLHKENDLEAAGITQAIIPDECIYTQETGLIMEYKRLEDVREDMAAEQVLMKEKKAWLLTFDTDKIYQAEMEQLLYKEKEQKRKRKEKKAVPIKVSVSTIKHIQQEIEQEGISLDEANQLHENHFVGSEAPVPDFMKKTRVSGLQVGTIYHSVLEHFAYGNLHKDREYGAQLQSECKRQIESGLLTCEEYQMIKEEKLVSFLSSSLGERIILADQQGKLHREQPFVIRIVADELWPELKAHKETVLVQGMIDLYFEDENGLVLVDYKTDHVEEGNEQQLITKYNVQIEYYTRALEMLTKKSVKERYLYSISLGKEIAL